MGLLEWWKRINGRPYIWGSAGGRSDFSDAPIGFDCSGFVAWAFYKASGGAVKLPAYTDSIATAPGVHRLTAGETPKAGDVVLYKFRDPSQPNTVYPHIAIYAGNGQVIQSGGIASRANMGPVNQLPGATYFRVDGAPSFSGDVAPEPVPMPEPPAGGGGPPGGGSGGSGSGGSPGGSTSGSDDHGGAEVPAGAHWDLWLNGKEGIDWIKIGPWTLPSAPGSTGSTIGPWKVPTPVGVAHAIGWSIHDAVQDWIPRAPDAPRPESIGVPIAFYMLGGLAVVIGGLAIGFQAIDAGANSTVGKTVSRVATVAAVA